MNDESLLKNSSTLISFSFISTVMLGFALFFYAVFTDYFVVALYDLAQALVDMGLIDTWITGLIETVQVTILLILPNALDLIWLLSFVGFVFAFLMSAYMMKRQGYFSALSFLTFGIMALLLLLTIFTTLSNWFQTEFIAKVMPNLLYATPFFSMYLDNLGLINTGLIFIAVVLNFVDLQVTKFNFRKNIDTESNELS